MNPRKTWRIIHPEHAVEQLVFRVIIVGTLSFSYSLFGQPQTSVVIDSSSTGMHLELEEVETLAEQPAVFEGSSLKPLIVITSKEITAAPAMTLEDLLDYVPQVDIRHRGRHGTQADVNIQGGTFDQSMVLLNGINLSDPQTGHFQMNLPVDLSAISQVEVITGSASRTFGANAFSGAIHLVTEPEDTSSFRAGFQYGQYHLYKAHLNSNLSGRYISTLTSVSTSGSDGHRENTDFKSTHAYIHSTTRLGNFKGHVILGLNARKFGANAFYSPRFPEQYEETTTSLTAIRLEMDGQRTSMTLNGYLKTNQDYFLLDRKDPAFFRNDHLTRVKGFDLGGRWSNLAGVTTTGVYFRSEQIHSTSLGEPLGPGGSIHRSDDITYTHGHLRSHLNWNINHSFESRIVSLAGGMVVHLNSDLAERAYLMPGFDFRFNLPGSIQLYGSANHSMRLPTFTDLYYQGPDNIGNPDLVPEKATTFELGLSTKGPVWQAGINAFYRLGRNMIDWIWMEDEIWQPLNLSQIDGIGGDASLVYIPEKANRRLFLLNSWNLSYTYTHLVKASDDLISRYLLDNLRHKVILGANLGIIKNLNLSLKMVFQDRNGSYLEYDPGSGETVEQPFKPFLLMDLKLSYSIGRINIFFDTTNLLNVAYNDIGNVIQPGRWMVAGFEVH